MRGSCAQATQGEPLEAAAAGVSHADHPCSMSTDMYLCHRLPHPKLAQVGMIPAGIYGGAEPINSCHRFDSELLRCKQIFDKEVKLDSAWGGHGNAMCSHMNYGCFLITSFTIMQPNLSFHL